MVKILLALVCNRSHQGGRKDRSLCSKIPIINALFLCFYFLNKDNPRIFWPSCGLLENARQWEELCLLTIQ